MERFLFLIFTYIIFFSRTTAQEDAITKRPRVVYWGPDNAAVATFISQTECTHLVLKKSRHQKVKSLFECQLKKRKIKELKRQPLVIEKNKKRFVFLPRGLNSDSEIRIGDFLWTTLSRRQFIKNRQLLQIIEPEILIFQPTKKIEAHLQVIRSLKYPLINGALDGPVEVEF